MKNHTPYWLAAIYLLNVPPRHFRQWLENFSDIETMFDASPDDWRAAGMQEKHVLALQATDWTLVEKELRWAEITGNYIITLVDDDYPKLLAETPDPPLVLYLRGNKAALATDQLAIVGSRHPTPTGIQTARQFAGQLAEAGITITSGLAHGIDSAAHRGALTAAGVTIAVTGSGLGHCYPKANYALREEIIENRGVVISEFPLDIGPHPFHFPRRNRIISGLSAGVLVVEAALKSGSLITVKHALEQGRDVFAIPGSIHQPLARGCHYLLRQGATLVENVTDILEALNLKSAVAVLPKQLTGTQIDIIYDNHRSIFNQVGYEVTSVDRIILESGLTPGEVSSILLLLELGGHIQSVTGGYVRIIPKQ